MHGWSFKIGGTARELDVTMLPFHARPKSKQVVHKKGFAVGITLASVILVIFVIIAAILVLRRIRNGDDILEDWEVEYGARRFRYLGQCRPSLQSITSEAFLCPCSSPLLPKSGM